MDVRPSTITCWQMLVRSFYPLQEVSSNSIMMQFDCEALMTDLVGSFTEIEENGSSMFIFSPRLKPGLAQLGSAGFARTLLLESMLLVCHDLMSI